MTILEAIASSEKEISEHQSKLASFEVVHLLDMGKLQAMVDEADQKRESIEYEKFPEAESLQWYQHRIAEETRKVAELREQDLSNAKLGDKVVVDYSLATITKVTPKQVVCIRDGATTTHSELRFWKETARVVGEGYYHVRKARPQDFVNHEVSRVRGILGEISQFRKKVTSGNYKEVEQLLGQLVAVLARERKSASEAGD